MARKYELPDETMQLISADPGIFEGGKFLEQRPSGIRPSEMIKALRSFGTGNNGFSQYENQAGPNSASARTLRRGLFNPIKLSIPRVSRSVTLPGAETTPPPASRPVSISAVYPDVIDDDIVDDNWPGDYVERKKIADLGTAATDDGFSPNISVGTPVGTAITDSVVGGTGNDTVTGGTGNDGTGGGGTGGDGTGGTGGTGTGGLGGGTGTTGTGVTTDGTGTTGGTDLRSLITSAMNGSGSIDNSSAGLDSTSSSGLTADQIVSLTKPKVASVTLESSGPALDQDTGATSMTFDYPELLSPEELKAYEAWLATQGGGAAGAGKPGLEETLGAMEF